MVLSNDVNSIEVYYDGRCGMCCTFHEWVNRQPRALSIQFIPYQATEAEKTFPGIGTLDPAREMIVRTDKGEIYRGAEAWVWCLYSCKNHQTAAHKLASPSLLPLAKHSCRILASNRHSLSKVFFRRKDKQVRNELHHMTTPTCESSFCSTE